jgi:hypothetical protein
MKAGGKQRRDQRLPRCEGDVWAVAAEGAAHIGRSFDEIYDSLTRPDHSDFYERVSPAWSGQRRVRAT